MQCFNCKSVLYQKPVWLLSAYFMNVQSREKFGEELGSHFYDNVVLIYQISQN